MNQVCLIGRITQDIKLTRTPSDVSVVSFSIAVDRPFSKGNEKITDFFEVVAWRQNAEFIAKYFTKGSKIAIVGSLQTRTWRDKNDNNRKTTEILVSSVDFCGSKGQQSQNQTTRSTQYNVPQNVNPVDDNELF